MRNYIRLGRYRLTNGLADDGSVWVARGDRIVWQYAPPTWLVEAYCRLVLP